MVRRAIPVIGALVSTAFCAGAAQGPANIRLMCDGAMRPEVAVATFAHANRLFPARTVRRGGAVRVLPPGKRLPAGLRFTANGKQYDLYDYLALNRVAGLLVLKDGAIAFEDYELGADRQTRWAGFSVAKSVASSLVGAALADGSIRSLDDPVTTYATALRGSAYEGVTVRNVLQMASGVKWDETYTDPASDARKILERQLLFQPGETMKYMSALPRASAPGTSWLYSTGEIYVVGAVLEGATHCPLARYLSEKIWARAGMERDAAWWVESPGGMGLAGTGLSATLRDYGRFGLLAQEDGAVGGKQLIPKGWFADAGSAKAVGGKPVNYGYLWWPLPAGDPIHEGAFQAVGIFGQHVYVNPAEKLTIVVLSARPKPTGSTVVDDAAFFGAVAKALH